MKNRKQFTDCRMTDHERLKLARENASYDTAADAARAFGWNEVTYRAHENGQNGIKLELARRYARAFRVRVEWMVSGAGQPNGPGDDPEMAELKECFDSLDQGERRLLLDLARKIAGGPGQGS